MKRIVTLAAVLALASTACIGGGSETRTVQVDYSHDQFAGAFLRYFPSRFDVHPGDTVVFRQTWTGEPHSVTMGTEVDKYGALVKPFIPIFDKKGWEGLPPEPPKGLEKIEKNLPWMTDDEHRAAQNGAQPCYLRTGFPPKSSKKACANAQQRQPEFDGRHSYYNSGFIPYQGSGSNTFTMKIAENARPGEHFFYCNFHGPFMSGFLTIKPKDAKVASQGELTRRARRQIGTTAAPLLKEFRRAARGRLQPPKDAVSILREEGLVRQRGGKTYLKGWLSGLGVENVDSAYINEFVPRRVRAKVGEKLTWTNIGFHTISFNVPKYFPIISVRKDGTVVRNPKLDQPAGGAPKIPQEEQAEGPGGPPKPLVIDAGKWDGRGFWSSGTYAGEPFAKYSLRITRPGTYKFACLIHPPMVGTLTVSR